MLVSRAKREGSSDNITVIVVFFTANIAAPATAETDSTETIR